MHAYIRPYQGIYPKIDPSAFIAPGAVIIGDVEIGAEASVWYGCVLRGDVNAIRIGARSNIQDGTVIHEASDALMGNGGIACEVGENVTVGHMALLHACYIESCTLIGMKACAMDGSRIKTGSMLAAGALLSPGKCIEGGQLWAGIPARFKKELPESSLDNFLHSASHYVRLAKTHASVV